MEYQNSNRLLSMFSSRNRLRFSKDKGRQSSQTGRIVWSLSIFLALLLPFLWGCNTEDRRLSQIPDYILEMDQITIYTEEDTAAPDTLKLIKEQIYGDTGDLLMGPPGNFIIDNNGTIYIGDRQLNRIHLFQEDGSYIASIGREGDGPGEFRWLGQMTIHSNHLYVSDPNSQRVNVFEILQGSDSIPEFTYTIRIPGENWKDLSGDGHI